MPALNFLNPITAAAAKIAATNQDKAAADRAAAEAVGQKAAAEAAGPAGTAASTAASVAATITEQAKRKWYLIGGAAILLGGFLFLRRKRS